MKRWRKWGIATFIVAALAVTGVAVASGSGAAAPAKPPVASTQSATTGQAAAASLVWSTKWELYYGSGYGGDRLVWSNRVPTWQVGDAATRMTFKPSCQQAIIVINKGATWSTPSSVNTPCSMNYHHGGDIIETQHGGAVIFHTNTYNAGTIYYYTALQLVTNTSTGEHWGCWNVYDWNGSVWHRAFMATDPGGVCENSV